jgi:hypothetical protein
MNDLKRIIHRYMDEAIALPENRKEDGSINWNYVDADCFIRLNPINETVQYYLEIFNDYAKKIEGNV